jgi:hypothetical protein
MNMNLIIYCAFVFMYTINFVIKKKIDINLSFWLIFQIHLIFAE